MDTESEPMVKAQKKSTWFIIRMGLRQLVEAFRVVKSLPNSMIFLVAAAFYNDGIQVRLTNL